MGSELIHDPNMILREFIKENEGKLYQFLSYLLFGSNAVDSLAIQVFREFGDKFRKHAKKNQAEWEKTNLRIQLYSIAWKMILKGHSLIEYSWASGRDTRPLKLLDVDLLSEGKSKRSEGEQRENILMRLARIEMDYRAPLVLKDVLGFEDEENLRILGLRWGVYRHRLHRGRLGFRDSLRGKPYKDKEGAALSSAPV